MATCGSTTSCLANFGFLLLRDFVSGSGFRVQVLGFRVEGLGLRPGFRVFVGVSRNDGYRLGVPLKGEGGGPPHFKKLPCSGCGSAFHDLVIVWGPSQCVLVHLFTCYRSLTYGHIC